MTAKEILAELKPLGKASYKKLLMTNHGVREPFFGVSVADLKKFEKRLGANYQLALDLYDTGNYDAMYLAGLIADDARMTKKDLQAWVDNAIGGSLPGATVAWVAAGSPHGRELALKWIDSPKDHIATAGWGTLSSLVAITDDAKLDLPELTRLMERVQKNVHKAPDAVRRPMINFLIAVGSYVKPLTAKALEIGEKIGPVTADLGDNDCKMPSVAEQVRKVEARGSIGKKRKSAKC